MATLDETPSARGIREQPFEHFRGVRLVAPTNTVGNRRAR